MINGESHSHMDHPKFSARAVLPGFLFALGVELLVVSFSRVVASDLLLFLNPPV
jgi:hypothetical protein